MSTAALIFDLDGTLVDSLEAHRSAYASAFAEMGVRFEPARYDDIHGLSWSDAIPHLLNGQRVDVDALRSAKAAALNRLAPAAVRPLQLVKLLRVVRTHLKTALVTSASAATVDALLPGLGGHAMFDVIVHSGSGANHKPRPDPFLLAVELLGVDARDVVVFEDSDVGVEAATAAGLAVIDIRSMTAPL